VAACACVGERSPQQGLSPSASVRQLPMQGLGLGSALGLGGGAAGHALHAQPSELMSPAGTEASQPVRGAFQVRLGSS
jgi:hypothetical protein